MVILVVTVGVLCTLAGLAGGYVLRQILSERKIQSAQTRAKQIIDEASHAAEALRNKAALDVKEEALRSRKEFEKEYERRRGDLEKLEKKIAHRETLLDNKLESMDKRERMTLVKERQVDVKLRQIANREQELEELKNKALKKAEEVSGMSSEEARQYLLENLEVEIKQDAAALIKRIEQETREIADKKARQVVTLAIQKCATDQVSETTVSVVNLPSDDMKGRIIGREGRNIRALEAATGCNIIVDDTPEAVVLSCFDPLRREVARISLERLISDGRIHPARIEDIVEKVQKQLDNAIRETGEQLAFDMGIHELHPEIIKLLGRLKYRTSYGQNVLMHSQEVAYLANAMAHEIGADDRIAKRAGLLHDIGKAVSYEMEGTHAQIGRDLARRYGESPAIVHAIAAHHAEEEPRTIIAVLVQAADAISAARPGARRETLESYIKRLEKLEKIADSFDGVEKSFAIQAGREVRIMVEPSQIQDDGCAKLARDITKRVEEELEYPGQIKVTVVRETRAVEYAR